MSDERPENLPPEKPVHRKTPPATPAVQAWLDGEQPREGLATPDEQETAELWARINSEAESLRKRHTPIHVQSKILSSLPDVPHVAVEVPDDDEPARLNMGLIVGGGIAVLVIGGILGFLLVR